VIDPNHAFTLHFTYTGAGCAHCGKDGDAHQQQYWMKNGVKVTPVTMEPLEQSDVV
jgi:hypothetical protein